MPAFKTYEEAKKYARSTADDTGLSVGVEQVSYSGEWTARFIPRKQNRYGYDARCEAVEPTVLR